MNLRIATGILLILGVFQFLSCRKQNLTECKPYFNVIEDTTCFNFDDSSFSFPSFAEDRFYYHFPCMNPNNNDEFVYYFEDRLTEECKIMKYSFITKQSTLVAETPKIRMPMSYSSQGWIAYICINGPFFGQLRVVKDDGTGDSVFSPDNFFNIFPIWDEDGEYLYWTKLQNPDPNRPTVSLRKHINGIAIDTILGDWIYNADFLNNKLLTTRYVNGANTYGFYDFNNEISFSEDNFQILFPTGMLGTNFYKWSKNGNGFYTSDEINNTPFALYRFSLDGEATILKNICASKDYSSVSVAINDEFLVATKIRRYKYPVDLQNVRYYTIWTIDLTTGEEKQVVPY